MSRRVAYSCDALADLENIETYIIERSPGGAGNVLEDIGKTIDLIAFWPKIGRGCEVGDLRFQITPKYRYRVIYRLTETLIEVRRVYHPRQLPSET